MNEKTKKYFEQFYKYSKSDVGVLLGLDTNAGPLLITILNGIDILGGMCYEFKKNNSTKRSIDFMKNEMGIAKPVAELLYKNIRCGMEHQGMPKMGIEFFIEKNDGIPNREKVFCKNIAKKYLRLNVSAFAHLYIDVLDKVDSDIKKYIHYNPVPKDGEKNEHEKLLDCVMECVENECGQSEIKSQSSTSASCSLGLTQ